MMKRCVLALCIVVGSVSCTPETVANNKTTNSLKPCESSKWKIMPKVFGSVVYGTSAAVARAEMDRLYGQSADIEQEEEAISITFHANKAETIDVIMLALRGGVVTKLGVSYSKRFQNELGGMTSAFVAIIKKMIELVGKKSDHINKESDKKYVAEWGESEGATLEVVSLAPSMIYVRYTCEELERQIAEGRAKNANYGF